MDYECLKFSLNQKHVPNKCLKYLHEVLKMHALRALRIHVLTLLKMHALGALGIHVPTLLKICVLRAFKIITSAQHKQ